jgi:hypothetical protein
MNAIEPRGILWRIKKNGMIHKSPKNLEPIPVKTREAIEFLVSSVETMFPGFRDEMHSVYVRGSCAHSAPQSGFDVDVIFVIHNETKVSRYRNLISQTINVEGKPTINQTLFSLREQFKEKTGIVVLFDINLIKKKIWHIARATRINFFSRFVYGEEDLTINEISIEVIGELSQYQWNNVHKDLIFDYNSPPYGRTFAVIDDPVIMRNRVLKLFKNFFRRYALPFMVNKSVYSRDLYYCYKTLIHEYGDKEPKLTDLFQFAITPNFSLSWPEYCEKIEELIALSEEIVRDTDMTLLEQNQ